MNCEHCKTDKPLNNVLYGGFYPYNDQWIFICIKCLKYADTLRYRLEISNSVKT